MNDKIRILIITLLVIIITGLLVWIFWPKQESVNNSKNIVCPQDAKLCPDGSYVSRTGPNCEFVECPISSSSDTDNMTENTFSKILITRKIYSFNETAKVYEEVDPATQFLKAEETEDFLSGPITIRTNNDIIFTPEMLKNATYTYETLGGGTVGSKIVRTRFENGICNICDESAYVEIVDWQNYMIFGNLNNDGQQDAVLVINTGFQKSGGNLSYIELAVMLNVNGVPTHIYTEPLGQSNINSLKIEEGKIIVEYDTWMEGQGKKIISLKLL
ncbi:MAG: hypothetical protein PHV47_01630 [Candidatus Pacebacteria bacterium]|nr:hypothetical protein [Candidatus Paceibacterota bacterium]